LGVGPLFMNYDLPEAEEETIFRGQARTPVQHERGSTLRGKGNEDERRVTISELANEFGIAPSAIRFYEEMGLLSPHRKSGRGQRLYGDRERARLKLILRGRRFGYSLSEIADILQLYEADPTQVQQIMRTLEYGIRHLRELDERIEELIEIRREMLEFAKYFLSILEKEADGGEARSFASMARGIVRELETREFGIRPLERGTFSPEVADIGPDESQVKDGKGGKVRKPPSGGSRGRRNSARK